MHWIIRELKQLIWLICRSMRNLSENSQRIAESVALFTPHRATVSRFCVYEGKVSGTSEITPRIIEKIILAHSLRPLNTLYVNLIDTLRHSETLFNTIIHPILYNPNTATTTESIKINANKPKINESFCYILHLI